ncbi:MAG: HAD family hydrolase [Alphaproteobacteria bacterium]|nr:HAD family hydrolase [Alphaproteobacteria bacterium]
MTRATENAGKAMDGAIRISMWSGPRNISTAMMRSFENRPDTEVIDEPFYAQWLARSGADHPFRAETLAAYPAAFDDVLAWLNEPPAPPATVRFFKHIAFHLADDAPLDWLDAHRSFALIREPADMAASYAKKFDDLTPIVRSYAVARRIADRHDRAGRPFPVVASEDILEDPRGVLAGLCAALDIPFREEMLRWPAGARASDGPWGPHWYDAVNASTGFGDAPQADREPPALTPHAREAANACQADYIFLRNLRLTPTS